MACIPQRYFTMIIITYDFCATVYFVSILSDPKSNKKKYKKTTNFATISTYERATQTAIISTLLLIITTIVTLQSIRRVITDVVLNSKSILQTHASPTNKYYHQTLRNRFHFSSSELESFVTRGIFTCCTNHGKSQHFSSHGARGKKNIAF